MNNKKGKLVFPKFLQSGLKINQERYDLIRKVLTDGAESIPKEDYSNIQKAT